MSEQECNGTLCVSSTYLRSSRFKFGPGSHSLQAFRGLPRLFRKIPELYLKIYLDGFLPIFRDELVRREMSYDLELSAQVRTAKLEALAHVTLNSVPTI